MSLSLREQLLAAGLVSEKKVKQIELEQSQQQYKQGKNKAAPKPQPNLAAQKALAEKAARDKELNRKKEEKVQRRARAVAINQLVEANRIPRVEDEGAEFYHFVDGGKVRRIAIVAATRERLVNGDLVVARFRGFYALVPKDAADKIRAIEASAVLAHETEPAPTSPGEDDPYKDFVVPDDLKW